MSKSNKILTLVLIGVGLIALAIFIAIFANGSETRTSEPQEGNSISAVHCTAKGIEDGFFYSDKVNTIDNEIKITYNNGGIDKMYYSYNGTYRSSDVVHEDEIKFHAKYNTYMGENGQNIDDLETIRVNISGDYYYGLVGTKFHCYTPGTTWWGTQTEFPMIINDLFQDVDFYELIQLLL